MTATFDHRRAMELIPWLVNGTLDDDERAAVERHVQACLPCRAELKQQRALAALAAAQHDPHLSPDAAFDSLMDRAQQRRRPSYRLRYAIAASLAIAVLGTFAILYAPVSELSRSGYETLARPGDAAARFDVVFVPEIGESQARDIVREIGGTIVAGPSEAGRYTVELDNPPGALEGVIASLEQDERIVFAGRSFIPVEER